MEEEGISRARLRSAWAIALAADCLQIVAFPFFWAGAASPVDDALDVVVAAALTALLGWHWSYLPSFLVKLTPALDLVPTWSAAVFLATRKLPAGREPVVIEAELVRPALEGGEEPVVIEAELVRPALEGGEPEPALADQGARQRGEGDAAPEETNEGPAVGNTAGPVEPSR